MVEVTIKCVTQGETDYVDVARGFKAICALEDGNKGAWPDERYWWLGDQQKVSLFVLVHIFSGCDFLPARKKMGFLMLWKYSLKELWIKGLFTKRIFGQKKSRK